MANCENCLHEDVCEAAKTCDGRVPNCKHFLDKDEHPKLKHVRWIPVTERLPENIGLFLVIEKHWIDGSPCRRIAKWNTQDWFRAVRSDRKIKEITPRVTHWMPLPEAPKEGTT